MIQSHIKDGTKVHFSHNRHLVWIDDLLSQKRVLPSVTVEQTPVHLQVPDEGVA